jgi:hypothetical protein
MLKSSDVIICLNTMYKELDHVFMIKRVMVKE